MDTKAQLDLLVEAYNELRSDADQFFEKEPNVDFWANKVVACKTIELKKDMLAFIDRVTDVNSVIWAVLDILELKNIDKKNVEEDDMDPWVVDLKANHSEFYDDWKIRRLDDLMDHLASADHLELNGVTDKGNHSADLSGN